MTNPRRAKALTVGLWICATIAVTAALLEIALRMILGLGSPVLFVTDPNFGYFPKGDQHLHRFFAEIDTDRHGLRSAPFIEEKQSGELRILFVGDSVPFGTTYVNQKDIFVEEIDATLRSHKKTPVSVLNASSPGWAPSNELGYIKAQGIYGADLVVLVYNTKDLGQPFTPYRPSALVPLRNPTTAIGELWSRYVKPRLFHDDSLVDPGSTASEGAPSGADEARVMDAIETTRQVVSSRGAHFAILFSPAVTADVIRHRKEWNRALLNLKNWASQHQVPILDLTPILGARDAAAVYFDGIHLRPAGDRMVADAFVAWLDTQSIE